MSKIGQKPITISTAVQVLIDKKIINVKGPNGEFSLILPGVLEASMENKTIVIKRADETKSTKSLHGLYRQLVFNGIQGVERLWQKRLEIVGTGYNVKLQGEDLVFKLGYSHLVVFKKMQGVSYQVEENTKVIVSGIDKQLVGQIAHQIILLRKPDVYKGKGIRYEGEKLRIKPGKKAKAAGTATGAA
ncbi:50S ribosomal protein L6 [Candidatus Roizmanbacteria bacterium]|nr:50S ribosomal protein L6 [Candidatus Roizmanbacteria bacterium]